MEKPNRKRLLPWLVHHCNENTFRGLKWLYREERIFCISWKHQSNRSWDTGDAEIFKAWGIYSGKYKDGENPSECKTRLRTALTKLPYFEEMKNLHNLTDPINPFKAYRILNEEEMKGNNIKVKNSRPRSPFSESGYSGSPGSSFQTSPDAQLGHFLEMSETETEDVRNNTQRFCPNASNIPTVVFEGGNFDSINQIGAGIPVTVADCRNISSSSPQNLFDSKENNEVHHQGLEMPSDLQDINRDNLVRYNSSVIDNMSIGSSLPSVGETHLSIPGAGAAATRNPVLKIKVIFMEQCVLEEAIDSEVRLFCGDLSEQVQIDTFLGRSVFGSNCDFLRQIQIPHIDQIKDTSTISEKQKVRIRKIQNNMERGLFLGGNEHYIYAQRHCKAHVFAWTQKRQSERLERERNDPQVLFDFDLYKQQLQYFITYGGIQPSPSVTITFGQVKETDILDPGRLLIYMKVTHVEANELLQNIMGNMREEEILLSESVSDDMLADTMKAMLSIN